MASFMFFLLSLDYYPLIVVRQLVCKDHQPMWRFIEFFTAVMILIHGLTLARRGLALTMPLSVSMSDMLVDHKCLHRMLTIVAAGIYIVYMNISEISYARTTFHGDWEITRNLIGDRR